MTQGGLRALRGSRTGVSGDLVGLRMMGSLLTGSAHHNSKHNKAMNRMYKIADAAEIKCTFMG
jgi:hypothetical protein